MGGIFNSALQGSTSPSSRWEIFKPQKKHLLITAIALVSLAALTIGVLALLQPHLGLKGLHGLNTLSLPIKITIVASGGIGLLATVLVSYSLWRRNDVPADHLQPIAARVADAQQEEIVVENSRVSEPEAAARIQRVWRTYTAEKLRRKTAAASKIQRVWRNFAIQKKGRETEAAIKIQGLWRMHVAKRAAKSLLQSYNYSICWQTGQEKKTISIKKPADIKGVIEKITTHLRENPGSVELFFTADTDWLSWRIGPTDYTKRYNHFLHSPLIEQNSLRVEQNDRCLIFNALPLESEDLGNGKIRHRYANGIVEIVDEKDSDAYTRIFPDGSKEVGTFNEYGHLRSGYHIDPNQNVTFIHPEGLTSINQAKSLDVRIVEFEGELIVLDCQWSAAQRKTLYARSKRTVEEILFEVCTNSSKHVDKVLRHPTFQKSLPKFIEKALSPDETGRLRLFGFSKNALFDVLGLSLPLTPSTQEELFFLAAQEGDLKMIQRLATTYRDTFKRIGQAIIGKLLGCGHLPWGYTETTDIVTLFEEAGEQLDPFHKLWLEVADGGPRDARFDALSEDQKRTLYEAAFLFNNPNIYEPAERPIQPDQYSINLMWINRSPIPEDQEFLLDDFHKKFVEPVTKWALANPGSPINIWVDTKMATKQAIENSHAALEAALQGRPHGTIQFRDVREIDVVKKNPAVFREEMPIYFRVDLLRAIAADHTLSNNETEYFVYGDIDMKPLSGEQLFDRRTLAYLDDLGFVMAKGGHLGFENGFIILNGKHSQLMDSHRQVLIDLSIEQAIEERHTLKEQQLYDTSPAMLTHLLAADRRYGELRGEKFWHGLPESVSTDSVPLKFFRYDRFSVTAHTFLPFGDKNERYELRKIIPCKPVVLPPSHF